MDDSQKPLDGKQGESLDPVPKEEFSFEESGALEDIIRSRPELIGIARARLKGKCSDIGNHSEDVVQEGIRKVVQAVRHRGAEYDDLAEVLRAAVWQAGVRHSQICHREEAVDFTALLNPRGDNAPHPTGHSQDYLTRKTCFDPTEIFDAMLDLGNLKITDWDLFCMRFCEGFTMNEIAKKRGKSIASVQRELQQLDKELGNGVGAELEQKYSAED